MADPTPLSPSAQVVLDAAEKQTDLDFRYAPQIAAAALRAAVDQAIPLIKTPWGTTLVPVLTSLESRDRFLAIVTELKNCQ
jgi:hypothetical protein